MKTYKDVLTITEAAKICGFSSVVITRCFDKGLLKGYRVPGSRFRRIPLPALKRFIEEYGIVTDFFRPTN